MGLNTGGHWIPRKRRGAWLEAAGVGVIILLATAFRLGILEFSDLWGDEIYSFTMAQRSFADIVRVTAGDVHPPLYYFLARLAYLVYPLDTCIRVASFLAAVATFPFLYFFGRRLGGPPSGFLMLALLACSPFHIHYSIEGRNYALGILCLTAMLWAAAGAMDPRSERRRRYETAYVVAALAAALTHNLLLLFVFVAGVTFMAVAVAQGGHRHAARWLGIHVLVGLLYLPWLRVVASQTATMREALTWIPPPTPMGLWQTFSDSLPFGDAMYGTDVDLRFYHELVVGIAAACGLMAAWASRTRRPLVRAMTALVMALTLLPTAIEYVVSFGGPRIFYPGRFSVLQVPAYFAVVALGLRAIPIRALRAGAIGGILGVLTLVSTGMLARRLRVEFSTIFDAAASILRQDESLYFAVEHGSVFGDLEYYAPTHLGRRRLVPLVHEIDRLVREPESTPPDRILLFDWQTAWSGHSSKEGFIAMELLKKHAKARRVFETPGLPWAQDNLTLYTDIDWPELLRLRRERNASYRDLDGLPWLTAAYAGDPAFGTDRGFASASYDLNAAAQWMQGADSRFLLYPVEPASPGGGWLIIRLWQHDAVRDRELRLASSTSGNPGGRATIPVGFSTLFLPFELRPDDPSRLLETRLRTDIWVPMESGVGTDTRELGFLFFWLGFVSREGLTADDFPSPPLRTCHPGDGMRPAAAAGAAWSSDTRGLALGRGASAALMLDLPPLRAAGEWIPPERSGLPRWDLLLHLRYVPGGSASTAPVASDGQAWREALASAADRYERERLEVTAAHQAPVDIVPWPRDPFRSRDPGAPPARADAAAKPLPDDGRRTLWLPLVVPRGDDPTAPTQAGLRFSQRSDASGRWIVESVEIFAPPPSLYADRLLAQEALPGW